MNEHGYCPSCGLNLDGGLIWDHFLKTFGTVALADKYAEMYGATRTTGHWGLATGMYDSQKDRTVGWTCPECNHYWGSSYVHL
jgi:hypothetical protein